MNNLEEVAARGRGPHLPPADVPPARPASPWPARPCTSCIALVLIFVAARRWSACPAAVARPRAAERPTVGIDEVARQRRGQRPASQAGDQIVAHRRRSRSPTSTTLRERRAGPPHGRDRRRRATCATASARTTDVDARGAVRLDGGRPGCCLGVERHVPADEQAEPDRRRVPEHAPSSSAAITRRSTVEGARPASSRRAGLTGLRPTRWPTPGERRPRRQACTPSAATAARRPCAPASSRRASSDASDNRLLSIVGVVPDRHRRRRQRRPPAAPVALRHAQHLPRPVQPDPAAAASTAATSPSPSTSGSRSSGSAAGRYFADVAKLLPLTYAVVARAGRAVRVDRSTSTSSTRSIGRSDRAGSSPTTHDRRRRPARSSSPHPTQPGGGRRRRAGLGAVDDDHQDGRRRGHARADLRARRAPAADIVRCTCNEQEAAEGLAQIVPRSPVPIVADIHHQYKLALAALEAGVHGLRLNPGNIRKPEHIKLVAQECKDRGVPIRIGVNGGSLDPDARTRSTAAVTPEAHGRVGRAASSPTSTRSASTT